MRGLFALVIGMAAVACGPPSYKLPPKAASCDGDNLDQCKDQCSQGGQSRACYRLGWFYEAGEGQAVAESVPKAVKLYDQACDSDYAVACGALGQLYWDGVKVDRKPKKAIEYFSKACRLGLTAACPTPDMVAISEGKKPKGGLSFSVSVGGGDAPNEPDAPDAPNAPSAPNTPSGPSTPSTPSGPSTPSSPSTPSAPSPPTTPSL